jgi:hypothetical protein
VALARGAGGPPGGGGGRLDVIPRPGRPKAFIALSLPTANFRAKIF